MSRTADLVKPLLIVDLSSLTVGDVEHVDDLIENCCDLRPPHGQAHLNSVRVMA